MIWPHLENMDALKYVLVKVILVFDGLCLSKFITEIFSQPSSKKSSTWKTLEFPKLLKLHIIHIFDISNKWTVHNNGWVQSQTPPQLITFHRHGNCTITDPSFSFQLTRSVILWCGLSLVLLLPWHTVLYITFHRHSFFPAKYILDNVRSFQSYTAHKMLWHVKQKKKENESTSWTALPYHFHFLHQHHLMENKNKKLKILGFDNVCFHCLNV